MKKLFTLLLVFFICMNSMEIRTNAQEQENAQEDESYLTVEVIENSFWEELESCKYPQKTKEDEYLTWLIEGIRKPTATITAFGEFPYINLWIGGLKEEDIDFDRFIYKCSLVIDLYNHSHDMELTMISDISDSMLGIDVESKNPKFIDNMVTVVGELAFVEKDTIYWESSQHFGSGKSGMIEETKKVYVNGVAYLDKNGEIISSYYGTDPKQIEIWAPRMLHICTEGIDLGWIYPTQIAGIDK